MSRTQIIALALAIYAFQFARTGYAQPRLQPHWQGETPCGTDVFRPPAKLPDGSLRQSDEGVYSYTLKSGVQIRYRMPKTKLVPVYGMDFEAVSKDFFKRRPIMNPYLNRPGQATVLAQVSPIWRTQYIDDRSDDGEYQIDPKSLIFELSPELTLADWVSYNTAKPDQKKLWDRHFCSSAHHEMGHILVSLQLLAQEQKSYLKLKAPNRKTLRGKLIAEQERTSFLIAQRQSEYHAYIAARPNEVMRSKSYLEQGFPWLKQWGP